MWNRSCADWRHARVCVRAGIRNSVSFRDYYEGEGRHKLLLTALKLILFMKLDSGRQQELLFRSILSEHNYCRRTDCICSGKTWQTCSQRPGLCRTRKRLLKPVWYEIASQGVPKPCGTNRFTSDYQNPVVPIVSPVITRTLWYQSFHQLLPKPCGTNCFTSDYQNPVVPNVSPVSTKALWYQTFHQWVSKPCDTTCFASKYQIPVVPNYSPVGTKALWYQVVHH